MFLTIINLALLLVQPFVRLAAVDAQTHITPSLDTNNTWTGNNTFLGTLSYTAGVLLRNSTCPSNVDTVLVTDRVGYVSWNDSSACAVGLPQAGTTGFGVNFVFVGCDYGAGTVTITPTTSTISFTTGSAFTSAASSMTLTTGQCAWIYSDNFNYTAIRR